MTMNISFETRSCSSLAKIFPDEELKEQPFQSASAFWGEFYSFQVAYRSSKQIKNIGVQIVSELQPWSEVRIVGLVPSEFPCYDERDDNYLRTTPGLYPDPLYPIHEQEGVIGLPGQWRSVWVTVNIDNRVKADRYPIRVIFASKEGVTLGEETFILEVIPVELPKQTLIHTEWFHTDCLATYYGVEVWSEAHWGFIDKFVQTAVQHGINMLLTPVFTPPLDTAVGGERPTVQLVDVVITDKGYQFGFARLKRWIDLCNTREIQYFEFSHLFSQWGAKHTPKIVAEVNGELKRIFGWDTDAAGEEYRIFLDAFLPELIRFVNEHGLEHRSYFHVSDEPALEHLDSYRSAVAIIQKHLHQFPVIDALSNFEFYEKGLVSCPIPANNHIEPFLAGQLQNLWTYYCCSQKKEVSNRFFAMPSARNRILGMQLFKFNIEGFLHWGYNFWYSQYSLKHLNPFISTDAGGSFPSGDPFLVYPGAEGPLESIRLEVMREALQDQRALQLLESLTGRKQALELLEDGLEQPLAFNKYPSGFQWLLDRRETINQTIKKIMMINSLQERGMADEQEDK
jgi:hypothetical protein